MMQGKKIYKEVITVIVVSAVLFSLAFFFGSKLPLRFFHVNRVSFEKTILPKNAEGNVLYTGTVYHIFFHSLIVYPELAFDGSKRSALFRDYLITRDEFQKILPLLYQNNFILVDITSLYTVKPDGSVVPKELYIPKGKKPLIISIDDVSYYRDQMGHGLAQKLVLDNNGNVATEVRTPTGETLVTRDGDIVPILDDFVLLHPDFSLHGAKGVLALTGYDGILGYRTEADSIHRTEEILAVRPVIARMKATGWRFASHSYTHDTTFMSGSISLRALEADTVKWNSEVRPLVGDTDIFIGPFGQIFHPFDVRRGYLLSQGFKMLCGVGANPYLHYFGNYIVMDRADIDGIRLIHSPYLLKRYFNPDLIIPQHK